MGPSDVWHQFRLDPRAAGHAQLRAADADRDVVLAVLTEAYAEGRLDPDELDERTSGAQAARTLGELPVFLADLVPTTDAAPALASVSDVDIHREAVRRFERTRREVMSGFLIPTVICWVVWFATMPFGFPWPLFPMLGTGIPFLTVQLRRADIIASNEAVLRKELTKKAEKKQRKELERRRAAEQPPTDD